MTASIVHVTSLTPGSDNPTKGILPTTNEITVLRYGEKAKTEQSSDGFYTQLIPAELLKEINIVDTPGWGCAS
jgi:hypothetical protein